MWIALGNETSVVSDACGNFGIKRRLRTERMSNVREKALRFMDANNVSPVLSVADPYIFYLKAPTRGEREQRNHFVVSNSLFRPNAVGSLIPPDHFQTLRSNQCRKPVRYVQWVTNERPKYAGPPVVWKYTARWYKCCVSYHRAMAEKLDPVVHHQLFA